MRRLIIFSQLAVAASCGLTEAESNVALPLLPIAGEGGIRTYTVPELRAVRALSPPERAALRSTYIYQVEKGFATVEARQEQARGIRELLAFASSPDFAASLEWTGPIDGITPGMDLEAQADAYYGAMSLRINDYSNEELELLQATIVSWIFTLLDLESKVVLATDTVTENELEYLTARALIFREDVARLLNQRRVGQLSGYTGRLNLQNGLGFGELKEGIKDFKRDILGEIDGFNKLELAKVLVDAIGSKYLVRQFWDRVGCGCKLKTGGGPVFHNLTSGVPDSVRSKAFINFWGDSLFGYMRDYSDRDGNPLFYADTPFYYPDFPGAIRNLGAGGSTSQDLRDHFDRCGAGLFSRFYPNPSESNHLQLENQRGVLLIGGNDFKIYEPVLRAIPWLSVFRVNNTLNNYNRIVSYHQAQNAPLILVSQTPRPVADYNYFRDVPGGVAIASIGGQLEKVIGPNLERAIAWSPGEGARTRAAACALMNGRCYSALSFVVATEMDMFALAAGAVLKDKIDIKLQNILFPNRGPDQSWLSMQTGALSAAAHTYVVQTRNIGWVNAWPLFLDPSAAMNGQWWAGNPALYLNDKVHYSHPLGQSALAGQITTSMQHFGWRSNPVPVQGDRCDMTPNTVFATGQPALWTDEPPPLPGVSDEGLLLIIICLLTGVCSL